MKKETMFELLMKNSEDMVYMKSIDGKYIASSLSNAELLGINSTDELIGKYDYELFDSKIAQLFLIEDKEVIETKKSIRNIDWVNHPKLGKILLECVKTPLFDDSEKLIGVMGISRNITDSLSTVFFLENTEVQTILDNIPMPVWIKDKNNNFIGLNKSYANFYDVLKDDIIGQSSHKLLHIKKMFSDENIAVLKIQDEKVLTELITYKVKMETIKGKTVKIIKTPIIDKQGKCVGLLGISHEIY